MTIWDQVRLDCLETMKVGGTFREIEKQITEAILARQEALVMAWVAETGHKPSDSVICHGIRDGVSRIWVETKDENDKRARAVFGEEET